MGVSRRFAAATAGTILSGMTVVGLQPLAAGAAGSSVSSRPVAVVGSNTSSNWSGYNIGSDDVGGTLFSAISGTWVVPKATQHKTNQAEDSATWVGIGGGCVDPNCTVTDNTLIQAGTEQDIAKNGKASYDAWWEIIPETETKTSLAVHPGDRVTVSIKETSTEQWSIVIKNLTTGLSFSKSTAYSSSMDTAEWIEETPLVIGTGGTGVAAMPNLTAVHFRSATLNGANPKLQASEEMQLVNNGKVIATPSSPGSGANSFNDCTYATTCAAP